MTSPSDGPTRPPSAGQAPAEPKRAAHDVPGLEHLGATNRPEPLATDGVGVVAVGTALWGAALLVMLPFWGRLDDADRLWWVPACATGFVLGLMGLYYCVRRRDALRSEGASALAAALRGERGVEARPPTAIPPTPGTFQARAEAWRAERAERADRGASPPPPDEPPGTRS